MLSPSAQSSADVGHTMLNVRKQTEFCFIVEPNRCPSELNTCQGCMNWKPRDQIKRSINMRMAFARALGGTLRWQTVIGSYNGRGHLFPHLRTFTECVKYIDVCQIALHARRNLTACDMRGTLLPFGAQSRVLQRALPCSSNVWTIAANKMYFPPPPRQWTCRCVMSQHRQWWNETDRGEVSTRGKICLTDTSSAPDLIRIGLELKAVPCGNWLPEPWGLQTNVVTLALGLVPVCVCT
jgi:hypothetical protein